MKQGKNNRDYPLAPTPTKAVSDNTSTQTKDNFRVKERYYPNDLTPEAGEEVRSDASRTWVSRGIGRKAATQENDRVNGITARTVGLASKKNNHLTGRYLKK